MNNFTFYIPTKVYFGKGEVINLANELINKKVKRVLLAYGGGSIKQNGIYDDVVTQIKRTGADIVEFSGIEPNPHADTIRAGVDKFKEKNCDFILAVGGGSTIDAVKAMSVSIGSNADIEDILRGKVDISGAVPFGVVLTMSGTGSELDQGAVISVGKNHKKLSFINDLAFPAFSVLDPTYTFSVPANHSAAGVVDAFTHVLEQFILEKSDTAVQNLSAIALMKSLVIQGPKILANPKDYSARANVMWAAALALAGFSFALGKNTKGGYGIHTIGHELSSKYAMTHGVTLALVTPAFLRYAMKHSDEAVSLVAQLGRGVFDIKESDDKIASELCIKELLKFYSNMQMPKNMREAGASEADLPMLAKSACEREVGTLYKLNEIDVLEIYKMAF